MKILYRGVDPKTQSILAACNNCKTQVEFLPDEAKYVSDQRDGDFYRVDCPVCGYQITRAVRGSRP